MRLSDCIPYLFTYHIPYTVPAEGSANNLRHHARTSLNAPSSPLSLYRFIVHRFMDSSFTHRA